MQNIQDIENKLEQLLASDKKSWVQIYDLMREVEKDSLYEKEFRSYTAWVNHLATKCKVHVSLLWSRLKAGKTYAEYEKRAEAAGRQVPTMNQVSVSPDNFNLVEKIAGNNTEVADKLMDQVVAGELKRQDLKDAWETVRADKSRVRVNSYDKEKLSDNQKEKQAASAADIILELKKGDWILTKTEKMGYEGDLYENLKKTKFMNRKFRLFTEFAVRTGTTHHARRIDALVLENCRSLHACEDDINIHGFEIKVSKSDLLNDHKMQEYTDFCDYFWLAVPEDLVEHAKSVCLPEWGIIALSYTDDIHKKGAFLKTIKEPACKKGVMRDKTLASVLYYLL